METKKQAFERNDKFGAGDVNPQVNVGQDGQPAPAEEVLNGKSLAVFINKLRETRPFLGVLLNRGASECVCVGNVLVIRASENIAKSINEDMPVLKKRIKGFFGESVSVKVISHDDPLPQKVPVKNKPVASVPTAADDAGVITDDDMNYIELIMSAMRFTDTGHRESVRSDLIEYLKEISIPMNRTRSVKGEPPALNIRKSRIFRFALLVKRAKNAADFKERATKAFRSEPYMHTPGRAIDRVNRGWDFPWNLRFKRKMVVNRRVRNTSAGVEKTSVTSMKPPAEGPVQETPPVENNVIHLQQPAEPVQKERACNAGPCAAPATTAMCGKESGCAALATALADLDGVQKRMHALETYLVRHFHREDNGLSCVPDDAITRDNIKEVANAGR